MVLLLTAARTEANSNHIVIRGACPGERTTLAGRRRTYHGRGTTPILANVTRLHHYMDHAGWAAVVVRSGTNFTYLAGFAYPGTLARHLDLPDSPREVLLLWPRQGSQ